MEKFSNVLKKYLEEENITYSSAAKMCGIDRTILGRFANGVRRPKDAETVMKIVQGLAMSEEDAGILMRSYEKDNTTKDNEKRFYLIDDILRDTPIISIESNNSVEEIRSFPEEAVVALENEEDIINAILYLIKGSSYIKMGFEPKLIADCAGLKKILAASAEVSGREYIIGLCDKNDSEGNEALKALKNLLPFLFLKSNYQVRCRRMRTEKNDNAVSGNIFITDKGVVLFDNELKRGLLTKMKEMHSYYKKLFDDIKARCRMFAMSAEKCCETPVFVNPKYKVEVCGKSNDTELLLRSKAQCTCVCIKETLLVNLFWEYINNERNI